MESHGARGEIHSFKQFAVEVTMIVLGVLIALSVEQAREHFREKRVAQEAREVFRQEMELDRKILVFYLERVQGPRESLKKFLDAEDTGKPGRPETFETPIWQYVVTGAWDTAVATQSLSYMAPEEVQRYGVIHTSQALFNQFSAQMQPVLFDLDTFRGRTKLTPEERQQRDRDIRLVLNYLDSLDQSGHQLIQAFDDVTKATEKRKQ